MDTLETNFTLLVLKEEGVPVILTLDLARF